jgi:hypothetical protein
MIFNRLEFLSVGKPRPVEVPFPELGKSLYVRTMTTEERDVYELDTLDDPGKNIRARLIVCATCDADGNRVFEPGDKEAISQLPVNLTQRLFREALKLNDITKDDISQLEKN